MRQKITRRNFFKASLFLGIFGVGITLNRYLEQLQKPSGELFWNIKFKNRSDKVTYPFPAIDWNNLLSKNEDVVGWITIPGTTINEPVVAENTADKNFYLSHNWKKTPDQKGAIVLDAQCAGDLLPTKTLYNVIVYGHNNSDTSAFSELSSFIDKDFGKAHQKLFLQTPYAVCEYLLSFTEIVNAAHTKMRASFQNNTEFKAWLKPHKDNAAYSLTERLPSRSCVLYTCTYTTYSDERSCMFYQPIRLWVRQENF